LSREGVDFSYERDVPPNGSRCPSSLRPLMAFITASGLPLGLATPLALRDTLEEGIKLTLLEVAWLGNGFVEGEGIAGDDDGGTSTVRSGDTCRVGDTLFVIAPRLALRASSCSY
jgi:hypothetical protein